VSFSAATNVVSTPSARQCAAVRIRSPEAESSTPPLQVCIEPAPRNTAPTLGSGGTDAAVGGALAAIVAFGAAPATCSTAACFAQAEGANVNAMSSPAARTVSQGGGKRMSIDLAAPRLAIRW
jgi:hypothetical protein